MRTRAEPTKFGVVPISICLWLGGAVTPNRHSQAVLSYSRLSREGGENPFIILSCPWCGVAMGPRLYAGGNRVFGYRMDKRTGAEDRIQFRCEDPDCDFSAAEGLPLEVVDEGIYERPPTLVIGTVEKFALMPWEPNSRLLFGIDNPEALEPPSLIIQDELHLISGPLGSMVGHYETVIDEFSTNLKTGVPAKIVASLNRAVRAKHATIARLRSQPMAALGAGNCGFRYDHLVVVFPDDVCRRPFPRSTRAAGSGVPSSNAVNHTEYYL